MGLRFRKRLRLGPHLFWNISFSKRGAKSSLSAGKPGLNVNIGSVGGKVGLRKYTIGLPGSGIRYDKTINQRSSESGRYAYHGHSQRMRFSLFVKLLVVVVVGFSVLYVFFD